MPYVRVPFLEWPYIEAIRLDDPIETIVRQLATSYHARIPVFGSGTGDVTFSVDDTSANCSIDAASGELTVDDALGGGTTCTVTASKAVVVDANKDISTFRNVALATLTASALPVRS